MKREGFTIIELLTFSAIFAIIALTFITILVSFLRVQIRETATIEVNNQSRFVLQTIEQYVESASYVDMATGTPTSTISLRMASSSQDPTTIYFSGGALYLQQGTSSAAALTTNRVTVSDVSFTRQAHVGGHDSVAVNFTMTYTTNSSQNRFTQAISTGIARVSAATFDADVLPSSDNTYVIGASSQIWRSINGVIYFSGSNVGIGTQSPGQTLEVDGGLRLNTDDARPTCGSSQRGTFWVTQSGAGTKDAVEVCARDASSTYAWRTIY